MNILLYTQRKIINLLIICILLYAFGSCSLQKKYEMRPSEAEIDLKIKDKSTAHMAAQIRAKQLAAAKS